MAMQCNVQYNTINTIPGEAEGVEAPRRPRGLGAGGGQAAAGRRGAGQEEVHRDPAAAPHPGHVPGPYIIKHEESIVL